MDEIDVIEGTVVEETDIYYQPWRVIESLAFQIVIVLSFIVTILYPLILANAWDEIPMPWLGGFGLSLLAVDAICCGLLRYGHKSKQVMEYAPKRAITR